MFQAIDISSESHPQLLDFAKPIHIALIIDSGAFASTLVFCGDWCLAIDAMADRWGRLAAVRLQLVSIGRGTERVLLFEHRPGSHDSYVLTRGENVVEKVTRPEN